MRMVVEVRVAARVRVEVGVRVGVRVIVMRKMGDRPSNSIHTIRIHMSARVSRR